ncbi:hypothetical protein [Streptomyces coffeae]|uniref:Uncharacterized protein n=1 Tax=Streptomyces coffeae TaxID=621382 RepID=A0ABS1NKT9_9ACTN|nr:hypothetical protein [Streptomyces coffeae]MBL1100618.1 hypothetical protein [Streptomyces coffeae]
MSTRKLTSSETAQVERAKQLVADLKGINWAKTTERDMARLLGRAEYTVGALVELIESGGRP